MWNNHTTYKDTLKPTISALSLNPETYRHPNVFLAEQEAIFGREWFCIATTDAFMGDIKYRPYKLPSGETIIITKDKDNYSAFYNVCRHRGNALMDIEDIGKNDNIICQYHCWSYDLNGTLNKTPHCDTVDMSKNSLYPIHIKVLNNLIFICTNKIPPDFDTFYGSICNIYESIGLSESMVVFSQQYKVDANWKLLMSNFCCFYHVPTIHPWLNTISKMSDHNIFPSDGHYIHFNTDPLRQTTSSPLKMQKTIPLSGTKETEAKFLVFWPNIFMFVLRDHIFSVTVIPISETQSIEKAELIVHNQQKDHDYIEKLVEFYTTTNDEDIAVCCSVQKGITNKAFKGGRYVSPYEDCVHAFDKLYVNSMINKSKL